LDDEGFSGLIANTSFDESQIKSFNTKATKPKVAILREQGVNGQNEMAAAFSLAGFDAVDVHMQDLLEGKSFLKIFRVWLFAEDFPMEMFWELEEVGPKQYFITTMLKISLKAFLIIKILLP
jgi:hypothetical protein